MAEAHAGEVIRFEHPGAGRRRAKSTPKGRAVSIQAREEVAALLGDRPRAARLPDRISAPDPGHLPSDLGGASGGAGR